MDTVVPNCPWLSLVVLSCPWLSLVVLSGSVLVFGHGHGIVVLLELVEQYHVELVGLVLHDAHVLGLAEHLDGVGLAVLVTQPQDAARLQGAPVQLEVLHAVDVLRRGFRYRYLAAVATLLHFDFFQLLHDVAFQLIQRKRNRETEKQKNREMGQLEEV